MMGHKICFYGEIWLVIPKLSLFLVLIGSPERAIVITFNLVSVVVLALLTLHQVFRLSSVL